ncbi:antizyme inhibitor 2 [Pelodytes ibericus]
MDKVDELRYLVSQMRTFRKVQLRQLQSLLGKLNFACKIVPMGRIFCRGLSLTTAGARSPHHFIRLTGELKADLAVWDSFLQSFNGLTLFLETVVSNGDLSLWTDVSGSVGFGGFFRGRICMLQNVDSGTLFCILGIQAGYSSSQGCFLGAMSGSGQSAVDGLSGHALERPAWSRGKVRCKPWVTPCADTAPLRCGRKKLNSAISRFMTYNGGLVVRYPVLDGSNASLYRSDGVHLTDVGLDLWNLSIQSGIEKAVVFLPDDGLHTECTHRFAKATSLPPCLASYPVDTHKMADSSLDDMQDSKLVLLEEGRSAQDFLKQKIKKNKLLENQDPFFVADLGDVVHKHLGFLQELPRVKPFYAVKCNNSKMVLQTLATLGTGFDCASKGEIDMVLGMGVPASDIVYANPCKQLSHIKHAARLGVNKMTFDCESELVKVAVSHLEAEMILRIKADDSSCIGQLSKKYGTPLESCEYLLEAAKRLKIQVVGVSFHIGSASRNVYAFRQAISDARCVFDIGVKIGHRMRLLDIGGGLPGIRHFKPAFEEFSPVINEALNQYFPMEQGVEIIAEPGRYYVGSAYTAALNIIAKKTVSINDTDGLNSKLKYSYYLNDGLFGSFMDVHFQIREIKLHPILENDIDPAQPLHPSTLWGPSCADIDVLVNDIDLPELNIGDWVMFQNSGAYNISLSTQFNGFSRLPVYYVLRRDVWHLLEKQIEE